jgi:hypothetical protein
MPMIMTYLSTTLLLIAACLPALPARSPQVQLSHAAAGAPAPSAAEAGAPDRQAAEVTEANWRRHPQIKAVRGIVATVNTGLKKGAYKRSERRFEHCDDGSFDGVILRRIAVNAKGAPAWYEEYLESEDRSIDYHYYYDPAGRLRFVLLRGYSAGGGRRDVRIYFDETGRRIWEDHKFIRSGGGGGPWPAVWSSEFQNTDPAKAFAESSPCPEIKSRPRHGRRSS